MIPISCWNKLLIFMSFHKSRLWSITSVCKVKNYIGSLTMFSESFVYIHLYQNGITEYIKSFDKYLIIVLKIKLKELWRLTGFPRLCRYLRRTFNRNDFPPNCSPVTDTTITLLSLTLLSSSILSRASSSSSNEFSPLIFTSCTASPASRTSSLRWMDLVRDWEKVSVTFAKIVVNFNTASILTRLSLNLSPILVNMFSRVDLDIADSKYSI